MGGTAVKFPFRGGVVLQAVLWAIYLRKRLPWKRWRRFFFPKKNPCRIARGAAMRRNEVFL